MAQYNELESSGVTETVWNETKEKENKWWTWKRNARVIPNTEGKSVDDYNGNAGNDVDCNDWHWNNVKWFCSK